MGFSDETYAAAKKYTDNTVAGAGGLAGVPCQIQSITPITGGNRVTFLWIDNNGDEHTSTMNVMNGVDGEDGEDGKGIQSVSVNAENHLIITYTDGTTADAGQIEIHSAVDSVNGQTGAVVLDAEDVGALPDDTPIPSKTSDLTNNSGFITKAVNDLVNYYLKSETYSKTEVDDIVTAIKNSRFEVVATLPTTDIKTNVIYLVPKSPSQTSNVKDEYINLDGTTAGWEKIGDTEIDLSDYVTTQALNTALAAYTTTADLTTLLAGKQDTLTFDDVPTANSNNPVKSGGVYSADQNIYEVMGQMGAKNLIPYDIDAMKAVNVGGTWSGNEYTYNGITFAVNSDGTITVSGIASVLTRFAVTIAQFENGKAYTMTGCPEGGNHVDAYTLYTQTVQNYDDGEGVTFNWSSSITSIAIAIFSGVDLTTPITFKPMLRLASDTDSTYQPYAKTNQELTAENQTLMNNVDVLFETGVKNICPPYSGSYSANGITYTGNSDGTVTVNGTCSANVGANIRVYLKAGQYKVSGCPRGGSYSTYRIGVTTDSWTLVGTHDHGNGTTITIPSDGYYRINLDVRAGYVANNLVFKPMITDVDTPESDYDHYVPYAKTNRQLTEDSVTWDDLSELGAVNVLENKATSGTRTDGTTTFTYTVNADKSVTISAPSYPVTVQSVLGFNINNDACVNLKANKVYRLSGCPEGGSNTTYYLALFKSGTIDKADSGNGYEFIMQSSWTNILVAIQIKAGTVLNNALTFKPMITSVDYEGDYVTYARSNTELTQIGTIKTITVTVNPDYATDVTLSLPSIYLGNHYWLCACQPLHIKKGIDIAALISTHANVITLPSGYTSGISMKVYYIVNVIANMGMIQLANRWSNDGMQFYAIDSELNTYIKNSSADLYMATITSFIVIRETT